MNKLFFNKFLFILIFLILSFSVMADSQKIPLIELLSSTNVEERVFTVKIKTNIHSECKYSTREINFSEMKNNFLTENNITHEFTERIQSEGNYRYYVLCKNLLNKSLISEHKEINIKVDFKDNQQISYRPVSRSSSEIIHSNIINRRWAYPESNLLYEWNIDSSDFPLNSISFTLRSSNEIEIKITKLLIEPVPRFRLDRLVYEYIGIDLEEGNVNDFNNINIRFNVPYTWFRLNAINPDQISFFYYDNGWKKINTEKISNNAYNVFYEAQINNFGLFSISVSDLVSQKEYNDYQNESKILNENNNDLILNQSLNKTIEKEINLTNGINSDKNNNLNNDYDDFDNIEYLLSLIEEEKNPSLEKPQYISNNFSKNILLISLFVFIFSITVSIFILKKIIKNKNKKSNKNNSKNNNKKNVFIKNKTMETNYEQKKESYFEILNKYKDDIKDDTNDEKNDGIAKETDKDINKDDIINDSTNDKINTKFKNEIKKEEKFIEKDDLEKELNKSPNSPEFIEYELEKRSKEIKEISASQNEKIETKIKPFEVTERFIIKKFISASLVKNISKKEILENLIKKGYEKKQVEELIKEVSSHIDLNNRLSNVADKLWEMVKNDK